MSIQEDLLNVLKKHAKDQPDVYVNPDFLVSISMLLEDYFGIEDDEVYQYTQGMRS